MSTFLTTDGTHLFYKDWGTGQPILFAHGWPLSSDAWDQQMLFFSQNGFRVIAHDRRSHGRSDQTFNGNHMNQYADDLAELIQALDLSNLILVGHSTGGGEVSHYIGRHGTARVAKVVLVGAVPPLMLKTVDNPHGTPMEVFDNIRENTAKNRSQFFFELTVPFYGFNRDGFSSNDGLRENFRRIGLQGGIKGQYDCIREFSEVDYTEDLKSIDRPTLIIHGDDDQIVPIGASAHLAVELVADATLKIYSGGSHGLAETEADRFNADVLAFIRG
ncbi:MULTISPECIES: alpha/beta fold hydrolase [unclassified Rhizobium]|uniref:alpha/beta fold hydrolase n=1 Tax=unclassified Rhizobium TaxID=2613769 RepID=UPI000713B63B|nr:MULTISPECIES: alpha/beta hydrolase [unclassified Rhizobium]KQT02840.1 chloroperoxidase [Rhizobium sp. Leaf391]KQU06049.1 chloroperoxidase [Rhizobium sp. Leaf453]